LPDLSNIYKGNATDFVVREKHKEFLQSGFICFFTTYVNLRMIISSVNRRSVIQKLILFLAVRGGALLARSHLIPSCPAWQRQDGVPATASTMHNPSLWQ